MSRRVLSSLGGLAIMLAAIALLFVLIDRSGSATATASTERPSGPPPKAVLDAEAYDFGTLDVGAKGEHTFVLRNDGAGPLTVRSGGTSCKCTLLDSPDGIVPPGDSRDVRLEWSTPTTTENFRHGAVLLTNDPDKPQIRLIIEGRVRTHIGQWPDVVGFGDLLRSETRTQTVTVYSQTYPNLAIADIACSHPNITWRVRPTPAETLVHLNAESAWDIDVTVAPGFAAGSHTPRLRVWTDPGEEASPDESRSLDIALPCEVVGEFSLYGAHVQGKTVALGSLSAGRGTHETAWLYVRGEHTDLVIRDVRCTSPLVDVRLNRDEALTGKTARYRVDIEVPRTAPPADHMGRRAAQVEIETDHPDMPHVHFDVEFAVVE